MGPQTLDATATSLIRIRSIAGNKKAKEAVLDYVKGFFSANPKCQFKDYPGTNSPALLVSTQIKDAYDIVYVMHLDVVDGKDNQFQPYTKDGRIYGRGAADMKGVSAVIMKMYENLANSVRADNIGLLFTTDEELFSPEGQIFLRSISARCAVVPDNRSLPFDHIAHESKGILQVKVFANGQPGHGSRPWEGQNAISLLITDLQKLSSHFPNVKDNWGATLNIGTIKGGSAVNQIADYAEAKLDIRTTNDQGVEHVTNLLKQNLQNSKFEVISTSPVSFTPPDDKYLICMRENMKSVLGADVPLTKEEGGSDAEFFAERNTPVFLCKPLSGGMHQDSEWIDLKSMKQYLKIFTQFSIDALKLD